MAAPKLCSVAECGKPATGRGYCNVHYQRWRRHGDPLVGKNRATASGEAIGWLRAHVTHQGDECLIWPYARFPNGRAKVSDGESVGQAARLMCLFAHGDPPTTEHEAAHSCGNGHDGCIHPGHLRWATSAENHADKLIHGTHHRGERSPNARLTRDDVLEIRRLKGQATLKELASRFGVCFATVSKIQRGDRWGWLD